MIKGNTGELQKFLKSTEKERKNVTQISAPLPLPPQTTTYLVLLLPVFFPCTCFV